MSTWLDSDWITEPPSKVVPLVKLHIMDPNGKSSKGVVTLTLWPSYPHKQAYEADWTLHIQKWWRRGNACWCHELTPGLPTRIHSHYRRATVTPRAMQSLEGRLRYCHTFSNFDTKWDEWAASRSVLLTVQWIRLDVRRWGNSCHCTSRHLLKSLTPSKSVTEKLIVAQLVNKSIALYGNVRFITLLTSAPSWARWVLFLSHLLKTHSNIILPSTTKSSKWPLSFI